VRSSSFERRGGTSLFMLASGGKLGSRSLLFDRRGDVRVSIVFMYESPLLDERRGEWWIWDGILS